MIGMERTRSRINPGHLLTLLVMGGGILAGTLIFSVGSPLKIAIAIGAVVFAIATFVRIEYALMALVFFVYTNALDIISTRQDLPVTYLLAALVVGAILFRSIFIGQRPEEWLSKVLFLSLYGLTGILSLAYAADIENTTTALFAYLQAVLLASLVVLILQNAKFFRNVVWTLLFAGLFMGSISIYQYLTGSWNHDFGGFALAEIRQISGRESGYRIAGPIGDANFYGQILIVLVPLALERMWRESRKILRVLATVILLTTLLAIVLTFSRGAFLALCATMLMMLIRIKPKWKHLAAAALLVALMLPFVPESYYQRMRTVTELVPGMGRGIHVDAAFKGRASEWSAAWMMFMEHPFLGVGLGNYRNHYQRYSREVGLDPRLSERSAHSLYLQIAAETGILGLMLFLLVLWKAIRGLRSSYSRFVEIGMEDTANLTSAFTIGLIGYLTAGIFLHTAYPNFLWMLLGIALALPVVARNESIVRNSQLLKEEGEDEFRYRYSTR